MNGDNLAHFLLRLVSGGFFILFGWMKLSGQAVPPIDKIFAFIPLDISVFLLGSIELVLGFLILIGMWTQISAWLSAVLVLLVLMSGAYLGLFMELALMKDISLLVIFVALGLLEPEEWSVDGHIDRPGIHKLKKRIDSVRAKI